MGDRDDTLRKLLHRLPKAELHRHLEGSLRLDTLLEVASNSDVGLSVADVETLRPLVQVAGDPPGFKGFLGKFGVLRRFYRSPEIIYRMAYEAVEDAAADNIKYLELRFTPSALASTMRFSLEEVSDWVCQAVADAQRDFDITVRLIVSMNRHELPELGDRLVKIALDRRDRGVVGLDLAGDEVNFSARPFGPVFFRAKEAGLGITVHAGEWKGAENVYDAIVHIGADRLGHGVRVIEDSGVIRLAMDRGTVFEVCITSNLQTGVVASVRQHPLLDMYYLGLRTTINTDDPSVSGITLTDEMVLAVTELGFSIEDIRRQILNAVEAAFLPDDEKSELIMRFKEALGITC